MLKFQFQYCRIFSPGLLQYWRIKWQLSIIKKLYLVCLELEVRLLSILTLIKPELLSKKTVKIKPLKFQHHPIGVPHRNQTQMP